MGFYKHEISNMSPQPYTHIDRLRVVGLAIKARLVDREYGSIYSNQRLKKMLWNIWKSDAYTGSLNKKYAEFIQKMKQMSKICKLLHQQKIELTYASKSLWSKWQMQISLMSTFFHEWNFENILYTFYWKKCYFFSGISFYLFLQDFTWKH